MTIGKYGIGGLAVCALFAGYDGARSAIAASSSGLLGSTVPKVARCAPGDKPEPGLQGQVPAAIRAMGFKGFNCNLELVGQNPAGGGISYASFKDDHGHYCAYYTVRGGINAVDITDPANPVVTATLTTKGMQSAGETLRVNAARQIMAGIAREDVSGKINDSDLDVYDLSADCRTPKLLWTGPLKPGEDGNAAVPQPLRGHDTNFTVDGLTFYNGANTTKSYTAIDMKDPSKPKIIAQIDMSKAPLAYGLANGVSHGLSMSEDGNRGYFVSIGLPQVAELKDPNYRTADGFYIVDTSEIQARKPNPQTKIISSMSFRNSSAAQHTLRIKIGGKPYMIFVSEGGSAGIPLGGGGKPDLACDAGLTPFPMARIIDLADETKPKHVVDLGLEVHDLANCSKTMPDIVGEPMFTYGVHICSVDNKENATALACGYSQSGIRVFDIRDPAKPKEIAYYNPAPIARSAPAAPPAPAQPANAAANPAANPAAAMATALAPSRTVNSCAAPAGFDFERKLLTTTCSASGALVLKFAPGTWPFPESKSTPRTVSYN